MSAHEEQVGTEVKYIFLCVETWQIKLIPIRLKQMTKQISQTENESIEIWSYILNS